jgi:hypothetical protein
MNKESFFTVTLKPDADEQHNFTYCFCQAYFRCYKHVGSFLAIQSGAYIQLGIIITDHYITCFCWRAAEYGCMHHHGERLRYDYI